MLPKNKLGAQMYRKLNVYAGPEHPHAAQKPEIFGIKILDNTWKEEQYNGSILLRHKAAERLQLLEFVWFQVKATL